MSAATSLKMSAALEWLQRQIAAGREYPDAHCAAVDRFDLTEDQADRLTELYDEAGA